MRSDKVSWWQIGTDSTVVAACTMSCASSLPPMFSVRVSLIAYSLSQRQGLIMVGKSRGKVVNVDRALIVPIVVAAVLAVNHKRPLSPGWLSTTSTLCSPTPP
jgi:hypothetical protein